MKLGIDIDGCLANFNDSFMDKVVEVIGEDKFPVRPFDIPTWNYPQHYGYTDDECKKVWDVIKADNRFWWNIQPYEDAFYAMGELQKLWEARHELYFITDRPGVEAKMQTEAWLLNFRTGLMPTVLISGDKAGLALALKLDFYIDDKIENCEGVKAKSGTNVLMMKQPWNKDIPGVPRIPNWTAFFDAVKESSEWVN